MASTLAVRITVRPTVPAGTRARRSTVTVRAVSQPEDTTRRVALGFLFGGLTLGVASKATALVIPYQESVGGIGVGGGSLPPNPSTASASGYTMEGTKKLGVDAKRKKKLLAAVREKAAKAS